MTSSAEANRLGEAMPRELTAISQFSERLQQAGAPADGRAVTLEYDSEGVPGVHRQERIWILGSRVIGELHDTGTDPDGQGSWRQITDVDTRSGELSVFAERHTNKEIRTGGGVSNARTGEDFWPMVDGVKIRQLEQSMYRVWKSLLTDGDGAKVE